MMTWEQANAEARSLSALDAAWAAIHTAEKALQAEGHDEMCALLCFSGDDYDCQRHDHACDKCADDNGLNIEVSA
jgi:hypothetical protein